ncbi:MAG: efflux RND transporter periplasmic adaptor subunit [Candidatus Manganitrophus sp. SA1]|nr:efflux RND transporter periplasmic adaptor subunit [Candidatus Manganitrophus morganii]
MKYRFRLYVTLKKGGALLLLLLIFAGCGEGGKSDAEPPQASGPQTAPAGPPAMPVEAARVQTGTGRLEVTAVGSLEANESTVIRSEIAGRITAIRFKEGERATKGSVLLTINSEEFEAQLNQIKAVVALNKMNFERAKQLRPEGLIAERAYDEAESRLKESEASLSLAQVRLDKSILRAPFSGQLGLRQVSPGDFVQPGQAIVNLEDTDSIKVDFRVPEIYLNRIEDGQSLQVGVDVYPNRLFEGKIYAIDSRIDNATRTVLVRARVPNPAGALRPGMFARVTLLLGERENAVFVPEQAVVPMGGDKFVYRVVDGKAVLTKVRLGLRKEGRVEVVEGIGPEETVITAGQMKLFDGAPVMTVGAAEAAPEEAPAGG